MQSEAIALALQERYEFLTVLSKQLNVTKDWARDMCKEVDAELAGYASL